jgi:hypothetical protein
MWYKFLTILRVGHSRINFQMCEESQGPIVVLAHYSVSSDGRVPGDHGVASTAAVPGSHGAPGNSAQLQSGQQPVLRMSKRSGSDELQHQPAKKAQSNESVESQSASREEIENALVVRGPTKVSMNIGGVIPEFSMSGVALSPLIRLHLGVFDRARIYRNYHAGMYEQFTNLPSDFNTGSSTLKCLLHVDFFDKGAGVPIDCVRSWAAGVGLTRVLEKLELGLCLEDGESSTFKGVSNTGLASNVSPAGLSSVDPASTPDPASASVNPASVVVDSAFDFVDPTSLFVDPAMRPMISPYFHI